MQEESRKKAQFSPSFFLPGGHHSTGGRRILMEEMKFSSLNLHWRKNLGGGEEEIKKMEV